jgi:hypothetical protein
MSKQIKRSQLVEGNQYYLDSSAQYIGTFTGRQNGGIYFTIQGQHPYHTTPLEGREDQVGFMDDDDIDGFLEVVTKEQFQ